MELPTPKPSKAERDERYYQLRNENRIRVYEHLKRKGFSNAAIAGVMANIEVETGGSFDPFQKQTATGKPRSARLRGSGYGLFQLDKGGKRPDYEEWVSENIQSDEPRSYDEELQAQLNYMVDSIFKKGKYRDRVGPGNADAVKKYIQTSSDPAQIALEFSNKWEMAGDAHNARRMSEAESILNEINQGKLDRGVLSKMFGSYNEGGMAQQMELFEDGGLKDEGGTVDPVSGNDVPPGSTQKEVRDDIPAQLSEGEFVFPADVVRYIGLEKLMQMRQEAKMGLQQMEDMGQMGNSDEATMPDDLPFDIYDLDIDDGPEYNVGGFVPAQPNPYGIAGTQPSQFAQGVGGYTPYQMPQYMTAPVAQAYVPPAQQFVPVTPAPTPLPTPGEFLPETPTDPSMESVEYINPETGERRVFTFVGGQPTVPIPEGFIPVKDYEAQQPPTTATPTPTVETARVREEDPSEPMDPEKIQRMKDRIQAARDLGYLTTEFTTAGFLAGLTGKGEAGSVTGTGYVLDGKGGLFDPLTGHMVPKSIVGAVSRDFDEFGLSQFAKDKLRSAAAQETEFGKDMYDRMVTKGINDRFDEYMKEAIASTDDPSEQAAARQYVMDVKKAVEEQKKNNNVGIDGRIINPFEAGGRGGGLSMEDKKASRFESFPLAEEAARGTSPRTPDGIPYPGYGQGEVTLTTKSSGASTTYRADEDPSPPPPPPPSRERGEGSMDAARSYSMNQSSGSSFSSQALGDRTSGRVGFDEGGLANKPKPKKTKKMKRGGLASKK